MDGAARDPDDVATQALPDTVILAARGTDLPTGSRSASPTAAQALDRADLPRMRMFHFFGVLAPLGAIAASLIIGGDPLALRVLWVGLAMVSLSNVGLIWLSNRPTRWQERPVGVLWIVATAGTISLLPYFGPFSAVVMAHMLGLVLISLGRSRWTSLSIAAVCIGGHVLVAVPILAGWVDDVGIFTSRASDLSQLAFAEVLIVGMLAAGYGLGRWARSANTAAVAELQSAMRLIGDQQQALAEVKADAARQRTANEGRWTGQQMGGYRIGLVLGRGAMGDVYEAQAGEGRSVAIKLLNSRSTQSTALIERFHREIEVAARLVSPHIVQVLAVSPPDAAVPYYVMERLHGVDLAARLRTETRLPPDELGVMLEQIARGLEVAQRAGVVHRDLKPHNLFLHEGATWKVLDFGVSKLMGSEGTLTGEGVVGTPQYMAPEQASGGTVTHLADVYALGAIAYRCLTGRSPFQGKDLSELVYQVVHTPPLRPSLLGKVSPAVEDVLAVALAKDPRRRFASAPQFAQAFLAARRGQPLRLDVPPTAWTG